MISFSLDPAINPTLSITQAAAVLNITPPTAYAAAARGEIPTIRIGTRILVQTAVLRRMLGMGETEV